MLCTVIDIRGDYAYVKYADTGVVSEVAIALLPWDSRGGFFKGECYALYCS